MTVAEGESSSLVTSSGISAASRTPTKEGVLLAAPIAPHYVPITQTPSADTDLILDKETERPLDQADFDELTLAISPDFDDAQVLHVSHIELLAALNGEKDALTLYLMPQDAEPLYSNGFSLSELLPLSPIEEDVP